MLIYSNQDFAKEYIRLSLLGVNNINSLKECTKVLPAAIKSFSNPDQAVIDKWLKNTAPANLRQQIAAALNGGDNLNLISNLKKLLGLS